MFNTALATAFEKAGLPAASVAFASACHDLARLALNRDPNPKTAVGVFLDQARGLAFRAALEAFLAAVAEERRDSKSDDDKAGHARCADKGQRDVAFLSSSDPLAGGASIRGAPQGQDLTAPPATQTGDAASLDVPQGHMAAAASSVPNASAGAVFTAPKGQSSVAPALAPPPARIAGIKHAAELSARVMSGVYLTERQGSKTLLDTVAVSSLDRRLKWLGGRAAQSAVEYNTAWLVRENVRRQAFVPDGAVVGDVLDATTIRNLHDVARAFASSPMVQLPEGLRSEIAA